MGRTSGGSYEYHSKEGYPCVSEIAAAEADAGDYDCMLVPGGFAPDFVYPAIWRGKNVPPARLWREQYRGIIPLVYY